MANADSTSDSIALGLRKAEDVLARRKIGLARRAAALAAHPARFELSMEIPSTTGPVETAKLQTAGFLVAAGDSWFDYPFHDVLKLLEDNYGYNVESAAHRGDPIEAMAYQGGQLDKFARCLEKVVAHGTSPKAVLLSGGGNDIAGSEFGMLLNNATSNVGGWNSEIVDGVLRQRILIAFTSMLASIDHLCQQYTGKRLPILVHGYDYPVPDGRGFWGGWPFPGPWLEPGFREKLFTDLATNVALMHDIIDRFNQGLAALVKDPAFSQVHYVDLRNTLSTQLGNDAYQNWWDNELHPTEKGFTLVTDKFAAELRSL
jgi:lysophospholipase L1-like esterase